MVCQLKMRKRVPVFRQMTDFTCGAAAALMVWSHNLSSLWMIFNILILKSKINYFLTSIQYYAKDCR